MTAQIIAYFLNPAWYALVGNSRFMVWNLFLALVPLAIAFWLFRKPRSPLVLWGTLLLLGATFLPNIGRVLVYATYLIQGKAAIYIIIAIAITLGLILLDLWQFRREPNSKPRHRFILWWLGLFAFIAFLPNAPYVLTDIIHLYEDVRRDYSVWVLTLAVVPQYLLFMFLGFQAYTLSLVYMGDYMKGQNWDKFVWGAELIVHALCAVGIYLGRFLRFNSWDIVTSPDVLFNRVIDDLVARGPLLVMAVTFITIASLYWLAKWVTLAIAERQQKNHIECL
ncbi:MAG: DUF1361 domain-containing protein [Cyanobacteriota bacterium]|nr:DUF1361 domain-containing protein [Cyanobacteriota bacterium]